MATVIRSENSLPGASTEPIPPQRYDISCVTCQRRKVKCDKKPLCSNCARLGLQCGYAARKRAPRRPKNDLGGDGLSVREAELIRRLNRLEGVVKDLRGQMDAAGLQNVTQSPSPLELAASIENDFGSLLISEGRSSYVNHNFWTHVTEGVDDLVQLVEEDQEEEDGESSPEAQDDSMSVKNDHQSFVLGYSSSNVNLRQLHPLPSHLPSYFEVYSQKVDPLFKILHMPALQKVMKEAADDLDSLSRSQEALLFAIYFAVATSMSADEVRMNFASDKKTLQDRYCFGVEQALARASFLDTSDLVTLQAFVIYLNIMWCHDDSRAKFSLSRSAIGVAQSLGLHRDGSKFKLLPFDCEMRRRLWWQLCVLDLRNSENLGSGLSVVAGTFDTKLPLNIDDSDLLPDATTHPEPRTGLTEMTMSLVRCEFTRALFTIQQSRNLNTPLTSLDCSIPTPGKDAILQDLCQHIRDKYIQYCTDSSPMALATYNFCQLLFNKVTVSLLLPLNQVASKLSNPEIAKEASDEIFVKSIRFIEIWKNLQVEKTKQWHWFMQNIAQCHAVAYLLSELCVREPDDNVTWAWEMLDSVFQGWKSFREQGAAGVLWLPMRKLIARARHKRRLDLTAIREVEAAKLQMQENLDVNQDSNPLPQRISPNTLAVANPEHEGYQRQWAQQQQYTGPATSTPWLLEDSAIQYLGLDMDGLEANMQLEGIDDLMQEFHSSFIEGAHEVSNAWDPLW